MSQINRICLCLYSLCFAYSLVAQTQESTLTIDYTKPATYEIAEIKVIGNQWSDRAAILNVAGLQVGTTIKIPSGKITNSMRNLLKLGLFSNVQIYQTKIDSNLIYLAIEVVESARLGSFEIVGVKKSKKEAVEKLVANHLRIGRIFSIAQQTNAIRAIEQYYEEKGFSDTAINVEEIADTTHENTRKLIFEINRNAKIKIAAIHFEGNEQVNSKKLKKVLGLKTKGQLFASSKLVQQELAAGKKQIVQYYQSLGYLDAAIVADSIWRNKAQSWLLHFTINEGPVYYFGHIKWKGNAIYSDQALSSLLGIKKGEVFNQQRLDERLQFSMGGDDISSIYMDNGYLFFRIEAIPQSIRKDTIDLLIQLQEGPPAIVDKVIVKGNTRTNEKVIRRALRTKPGQQFSRAAIIRSQRELVNLGYFNPENLDINTPINPERGTVDVEYTVEEKSADKFELAGGWGGGIGLTGTVGVSFNNFSLRNLLKADLWNPLPTGDGQRTSIRFQSNGKAYQSLNLSFTEPWLGGKKPNALSTNFSYTRYFSEAASVGGEAALFNIFGASVNLGSRLPFLEENFVSTTSIGYQKYTLNDWRSALFRTNDGQTINEGIYHNLSFSQAIARSTINHPIYPTGGSSISLSMQLTVPYSLFSKKDYAALSVEERFKWLEYHKWRFDATWYRRIVGKLVFKACAKLGFVGNYNKTIGISPFERFQLGGDGLSNVQSSFTGTDIVALRGYEIEDLDNNLVNGEVVATPIFNKFTMEFRYPLMQNPNATIYGLAFLEAGNAYQSFKKYNPFDVKRSVGFGVRAHLPMFGTLGFDYGIGFDKAGKRSLQNYGKISLVLGFEPE